MSGNGHAAHDPGEAPTPLPSRIVVTFRGPGLSGADVAAVGVTEGQFYEAAWLLDAMAHEVRAGQVMAQAQRQPGLAVAGMADIAAVVREVMGKVSPS